MNTKANEVLLANLSPELKQAIQGAANALTTVLDEIHQQEPATPNYAGDYLRVLSYKPREAKFLAIAMLYAGANPSGIQAAMKTLDNRHAIHLKP